MMRAARLLPLALLWSASAWAADRYVVSYATRMDEGPALTVVADISADPSNAGEEALRTAFLPRLEGRQEKFETHVAVFATRAEAERFRAELIARASATGTVEELKQTVAQMSVGLWREHESEFNTWPFGAAEAKRRQLRAAEIWNLPLTTTVAGREFVLIPPGEFVMGSPPGETGRGGDEVQHRVRITAPFYLAREDEAFEVDRWSTTLNKLIASAPAGYRFRIPTEAEWEYAARAGTEGPTYSETGQIPGEYGDPVATLTWNASVFHGWESALLATAQAKGGVFFDFYASCQKRTGTIGSVPLPARPMACRDVPMSVDYVYRHGLERLVTLAKKAVPGPARKHAPNAWGLYDILGRYDEIVADIYKPYPTDPITVDPRQETDLLYVARTTDFNDAHGQGFITRGGHFASQAGAVRAAARAKSGWSFNPYNFIAPNGIRLVLEIAPGSAAPVEAKDPWDSLFDKVHGPEAPTDPGALPLPRSR